MRAIVKVPAHHPSGCIQRVDRAMRRTEGLFVPGDEIDPPMLQCWRLWELVIGLRTREPPVYCTSGRVQRIDRLVTLGVCVDDPVSHHERGERKIRITCI